MTQYLCSVSSDYLQVLGTVRAVDCTSPCCMQMRGQCVRVCAASPVAPHISQQRERKIGHSTRPVSENEFSTLLSARG